MTDTSTVTSEFVEEDPNRIPHLLCGLDKYMMQHPQVSLVDIVLKVASLEGCKVAELSDETITAYLKDHANKW